MGLPRIFQSGDFQTGISVTLSESAFRHVVKVLRLKTGDEIILFNGKGHKFMAQITHVDKHQTTVLLTEHLPTQPPKVKIALFQAIVKPDKMDLIIQKAVELGVTEIFPLSVNIHK